MISYISYVETGQAPTYTLNQCGVEDTRAGATKQRMTAYFAQFPKVCRTLTYRVVNGVEEKIPYRVQKGFSGTVRAH